MSGWNETKRWAAVTLISAAAATGLGALTVNSVEKVEANCRENGMSPNECLDYNQPEQWEAISEGVLALVAGSAALVGAGVTIAGAAGQVRRQRTAVEQIGSNPEA